MFSRASKTLHSGCAVTACADEWLCQRGLNEGWVFAQEKIKSAAGFDVRWQRLFDEHGDEFTGVLRARLQSMVKCVLFRHA
jgi:hypothetical protein